MPKTTRPSIKEHRAWVALYGTYEPRVSRPDREETGRAVARVAEALGEPEVDISIRHKLITNVPFTPAERAEVEETSRQAVAVVAMTVERAGQAGQRATHNRLFDALAVRWSPTYGRVVDTTLAKHADQMRKDTIERVRRDLISAGLRLETLFALASAYAKARGFIKLKLTPKGWRVRPAKNPFRPAPLLRADDPPPPRQFAHKITAEIAYTTAPSGPRSLAVMRILESTRLVLSHRRAERELADMKVEYDDAKAAFDRVIQPHKRVTLDGGKERWEPPFSEEEIAALERLRDARGPYFNLRSVVNTLPRSGSTVVKTRMFQAVNRRWNATYYWPEHIGAKNEQTAVFHFDEDDADAIVTRRTTRRARIFQAHKTDELESDELVGVDVSSSQYQILSVLLGDTNLEALLQNRSAHEIAAQIVWPDAFDGDGPARAKAILVPGGYGSKPYKLAKDTKETIDDIRKVLNALGPEIEKFRSYCRKVAWKVDAYRGFEFTDPFDRSQVCWYPIHREKTIVGSDRVQIVTYVPKGALNDAGRGLVRRGKLQNQIAPMLIHALDSAFSGHVIEALHRRGARSIVALFDCWLVPREFEHLLDPAVKDAAEPWMRSLRYIYDALLAYDVRPKKLKKWLADLKEKWQGRVDRGEWPTLRTKPVLLTEWE